MEWIWIQFSAGKKNCNSKPHNRSESTANRIHLSIFSADWPCFGIGLLMTKCVEDNFKVILKLLCNLDHFPHGCFLNIGEPKLKIYLRVGKGFTFRDSLEVLLEPPSKANL